jgi:hypothetical protein
LRRTQPGQFLTDGYACAGAGEPDLSLTLLSQAIPLRH